MQDPYNFTESYEYITENQESNILPAFLGLESTFEERNSKISLWISMALLLKT